MPVVKAAATPGTPPSSSDAPDVAAAIAVFEEGVKWRVAIELDATPQLHLGYGEPTNIVSMRGPPLRSSSRSRVPEAFGVLAACTRCLLVKAMSTPIMSLKADIEVHILPIMGAVVYATNPPGQTTVDSSSRPNSRSTFPLVSLAEEDAEADTGSASASASTGPGDAEKRRGDGTQQGGLSATPSSPPRPPHFPLAGAWDPRLSLPSAPTVASAAVKKGAFSLQSLRTGGKTAAALLSADANKTTPQMVIGAVRQLAALQHGQRGGWFLELQIGGPWGELKVGSGKGMQVFVSRQTEDEEAEEKRKKDAEAEAAKKAEAKAKLDRLNARLMAGGGDSSGTDTDEDDEEDDDEDEEGGKSDSVSSEDDSSEAASSGAERSQQGEADDAELGSGAEDDDDEGDYRSDSASDDGDQAAGGVRARRGAMQTGAARMHAQRDGRRGGVDQGAELTVGRRKGVDGGQRETWQQRRGSIAGGGRHKIDTLLGPKVPPAAVHRATSPQGSPNKTVAESREIARRRSSLAPSGIRVFSLVARLRQMGRALTPEVTGVAETKGSPGPTKEAFRDGREVFGMYQEWQRTRTLREVLLEGRHVSWRNVQRWTLQLSRSVLWCHAHYLTLGALDLDDVWMVPDLVVLRAARDQGRREAIDARSIAARKVALQRLVRGLGKKKRRQHRREQRAAMQARDAWINPACLVDALGSQDAAAARDSLRSFPALLSLDYKMDGKISMPDRAQAVAQVEAQLGAFGVLAQRDLRQLGLLVAQMLLHRPLTAIESLRLRHGDHAVLQSLVDNLTRAPPAIQALLKVCFEPPQAVERTVPPGKFSEARSTVTLSLPPREPLAKAVQALREDEKRETEDRSWVRPERWTKADERLRVLLIEQRVRRLEAAAAQGPRVARVRLAEDRRKLAIALMPPEKQEAVRRREEREELSRRNIQRRRRHMRMARFAHNSAAEMRAWLRDAILGSVRKAWALKRPLLKDRSKRLGVDDATRVRETLSPLHPAVMNKLLLRLGVTCNAFKAEARGSGVALTAHEIDTDMDTFAQTIAREVATGLCDRLTGLELARLLDYAVEEAAIRMERSSLASMLAPALFQRKKISTQAEALAKAFEALRETLEDVADSMLLHDVTEAETQEGPGGGAATKQAGRPGSRPNSRGRSGSPKARTVETPGSGAGRGSRGSSATRPLTGLSPPPGNRQGSPSAARPASRKGASDPHSRKGWVQAATRMVCLALLERYDEQRWLRDSGREVAASMLCSLARRQRVLNIIRRVWGRAREQHMKILSREREEAQAALAKRLASGYEDQRLAGAVHAPVRLIPPRLLEVFRPSRESDPTQRGKDTLDVLLSVMLPQSSFGHAFLEDGKSKAGLLEATVVQVRSPFPLTSRVSRGRTGLGSMGDPHHGELLVLLHDGRSAPGALSRAVERLASLQQAAARAERAGEQWPGGGQEENMDGAEAGEGDVGPESESGGPCLMLPCALLVMPGEEEAWTRAGFARRDQAQRDCLPLSAEGCPERLRVRVRGLQPNCSYRVRAFVAADLAPCQAWERVLRMHGAVSSTMLSFRPVAAAGFEAPLHADLTERLARVRAEYCERVTMEHDERCTRAAYEAEDVLVALALAHSEARAADEEAAKAKHERLGDDEWRLTDQPEAKALLQAWFPLRAPLPQPSPAELALQERPRVTDCLRVPLAPSAACLAATTSPMLPQCPSLLEIALTITEGADAGWDGPEPVWPGDGDKEDEDGEEEQEARAALLGALVLEAGRRCVSECVVLASLRWEESASDGGCRTQAFSILRSLVLESRPTSAHAPNEDEDGWTPLWEGPVRSVLTRPFSRRAPRTHSDRLALPSALPLPLLRAWRWSVDAHAGPGPAPAVRVVCVYRVRTRTRVGLSPFSAPVRAPLLLLSAAKLSEDLCADRREVLCERVRAPAKGASAAAEAAAAILDTADAAGTRLRSIASGGPALQLKPVSEVQLLVAERRREQRAARGEGVVDAGESSGGVAGRLRGVGEWMERVRGEAPRVLAPLLALQPAVPPALASPFPRASAALLPYAETVAVVAPALSPRRRLEQTRAWRLLDDLCLPSPGAQAASPSPAKRALAPLPLMRKWGLGAGGGVEEHEEEGEGVEALVREMAEMERLRAAYERALRGEDEEEERERGDDEGKEEGRAEAAVQDGVALNVRSRGDEWLRRLSRASPLR